MKAIHIPDIGNATEVEVIDVMVKPGDVISKEDPLITLESDKASMDIPAPCAGKVVELKVSVGDKVSEGDLLLLLEGEDAAGEQTSSEPTVPKETAPPKKPQPSAAVTSETPAKPLPAAVTANAQVYAGPAVRRLANELEIDISRVQGTGDKGRVTKADLTQFIKQQMQGGGMAIAPMPAIDFSQFGEITLKPLSKIKRLTAQHVHRSWVTIPHVTQFDEADITELENFRQQHKAQAEDQGVRLTPLAFIVKAVVKAMQEYPQFNASLHTDGQQLVMKKYFHIGVAADTPNGLVVPVLRNVDCMSVLAVAKTLGTMSKKAREKGLTPAEMSGSCFTVSSLGGIGGTGFTPIVNAPDVAILGVARSAMKPVYQAGSFVPRLMLPFSLSYDHRVIDGAEAARFTKFLSACLSDMSMFIL